MSDPIAQAAEALNAAPMEPAPQEAGTAASGELPSTNAASQSSPAEATTLGNVLVNSTPTVEAPNVAPAADAGAQEAGVAPTAGGDELPRESHLMLLEAKLGMFRAKLVNAERVSLDEFEAIVGHIKAVL
ncbi:hypothetical protein [Paraburkholderia azotifigens]|uniref:hypothetical protein n=1 Tax=Paraburkholderia azotifigens TaxID=2057004 RepID=UPI0038B6F182